MKKLSRNIVAVLLLICTIFSRGASTYATNSSEDLSLIQVETSHISADTYMAEGPTPELAPEPTTDESTPYISRVDVKKSNNEEEHLLGDDLSVRVKNNHQVITSENIQPDIISEPNSNVLYNFGPATADVPAEDIIKSEDSGTPEISFDNCSENCEEVISPVESVENGEVNVTSLNDEDSFNDEEIAIESVPVIEEIIEPACGYCGSTEHIDSKYCAIKAIDKGAIGRWSIPRVGVDVAAYAGYDQAITDAKDSANYIAFGSQHLIADHRHQGFNAIKSCEVGDIAFLDIGTEIKEYVCTGVILGYNTRTDLVDEDYNSVANVNPGGITCYTCNANQTSVTIVFFEAVSE